MNSRRFIAAPRGFLDRGIVAVHMSVVKACLMSALGQKQTCAVHKRMSALPPIATLIAPFRHFSFGPEANVYTAYRSEVGATPPGDFKPKRAQRPGTLSRSISSSYLRRSAADLLRSGQIARNSRKKSSKPAGEMTSMISHGVSPAFQKVCH